MFRNLAKLCCGDLVIDKIGLMGTSFLCIFGNPYSLGLIEPIGLMSLNVSQLTINKRSTIIYRLRLWVTVIVKIVIKKY